ncbi:endochitinase 42, partial [Aspergillus steynii IBT 23096]
SGYAVSLYQLSDQPYNISFNTDEVVSAYLEAGIPAYKIILGMPLYGRVFARTDGPGTCFFFIPAGYYECGIYDYKDLPLDGAEVKEDLKLEVSWSYNLSQCIIVSYDIPNIIKLKVDYIRSKGLGGRVF